MIRPDEIGEPARKRRSPEPVESGKGGVAPRRTAISGTSAHRVVDDRMIGRHASIKRGDLGGLGDPSRSQSIRSSEEAG